MRESKDLSVIVTGASGGIGSACAKAFLQAEARVVLTDIDESGRELAAGFGPQRCRFIHCDLSDEQGVHNLIQEVASAFGSIDVLVNNAAVLTPTKPLHETSTAEFNALIGVNLRGLFFCCKYAFPYLKDSRGCIVNISSMAGVHGEKHHAIYSATKGAINTLTRSMAVDYGQEGIRCNAVCPSSVITPNSGGIIHSQPNAAEIVKLRNAIHPLGYTASADEIAAVVVFLASSKASYMTGAVIPVNGGEDCGYGIKY
jgi:meso-butanediol dehydrogenase/(S,S)-butanediol dehydrogenase/diacetyl reductase